MKTYILPLLTIIIGYFALSLIIHFFSNALIYFPPRAGYADSQNIIKLKTKDGALISAVYLPNMAAKYTMLVSHGNAEDIGYMLPFLEEMRQQGFSVFAYDYHGYGTSSGSPNEKNCYNDINAAYAYLTQKIKVPPQQIILYGRSIGAAVALDLAIRHKAVAIIMESPFVTAYRTVTHFPIFAFDQFDNLTKIKELTIPLLIIHGTRDNIVPMWHSIKLYQNTNVFKQYFFVENAGHNDILWVAKEKYWQALIKFAKNLNS